MNAVTDTTATEIAKIHVALDTLLRAIVAHDHQQPPGMGRLHSAREVSDELMSWLRMTAAQQIVNDLFRDPVREALCNAVTQLGDRLGEIGGLAALDQALAYVEAHDAEEWERRVSILNVRWDGIAGWAA